MSDTSKLDEGKNRDNKDRDKPKNTAPDAVKDPNEKTEGHPGMGPQGGGKGEDADPGGG